MIEEITQNITEINEVPLRSEETNETIYRTKVENFLKAVKRFSIELKSLIGQIRRFIRETNQTQNEINHARDETISSKNIAVSAKNEAITAANRAETIVIPTEATYNYEAIDSMFSGVLTKIVAFQAEISFFKNVLKDVYLRFKKEREYVEDLKKQQNNTNEKLEIFDKQQLSINQEFLRQIVAQQAQISILK